MVPVHAGRMGSSPVFLNLLKRKKNLEQLRLKRKEKRKKFGLKRTLKFEYSKKRRDRLG